MKLSKGFYFTFLASIAWAISIILARLLLTKGENALNLAAWTTLIYLPFWLFVFMKHKKELKKATKRDHLLLLAIGLISTIGVTIVEVFALKFSPAMNYSFLIRSVILFTFIFAYIFLNEKLTFKKISLCFFILLGSYLLTTKGQALSLTTGDIFTLIEAALIALGNNVFGKLATMRLGTDLTASASILIGALPVISLVIITKSFSFPKSFFLVVILSVFYVLITLLRYRAYKNATASYVTMVFSFTPVFVSFMAIPFLGESLELIQIVGGLFIIAAGMMVEFWK